MPTPPEHSKFKKGKSGNPKGRPPKLATSVIRELKDQGVARVDRSEVDELIARLQNVPRKKLLEFVKDEANTPIIVALIARGLAGAKGHEFMTRDLWDRAHGRPKQAMDLSGTLTSTAPSVTVQVLPPSHGATGG